MQYGRSQSSRMAAGLCAAALTMGLAMPGALAETSGDVRARAARENERLEELVTQLEDGRKEVDGLDEQIGKLALDSMELQGELIEDRGELRSMVSTSYRWGGGPTVWEIALSSDTLDDFISRLYYANKVTQWQAGCVEQLNEDKRLLDEQMNQIEDARNERKDALAELEETCTELTASVESLLKLAEGLEAKERAAEEARLAQIAKQAAAEAERSKQQQAQAQATSQARALAATAQTSPETLEANAADDDARAAEAKVAATQDEGAALAVPDAAEEVATASQGDASSEEVAAQPAEEDASRESEDESAEAEGKDESAVDEDAEDAEPPVEPAESEEAFEEGPVASEEAPVEEAPAAEPAEDEGGDWIECIASAYTIADNTPPGSTATASGIPLDESVPTVALPISSNPSQFYGSMVQIEYEGMTVVAMVTDCGGLGGGSRGIDLTPAVFRAFGVDDGDEWGLRSVRYRFL